MRLRGHPMGSTGSVEKGDKIFFEFEIPQKR
jgi:hypothetical protein